MSHFKRVWLSFWRKDQGVGMIEAALFLPMFLMFAFAIIDFGNYMIVKNRIVSANTAIANAIENNPNMGAATLDSVITRSLGNDMYSTGYMGVAVWTSKEPPTPQTSPERDDASFIGDRLMGAGGRFWGQRTLTNPWLGGDPSDDRNPYYVAVFVYRSLPYLTPLPKLLGLSPDDNELSRQYGAPYGRKPIASFTFRTLNVMTCTGNQVLQSTAGGSPVCVDKDPSDMTCPSGQVVKGFRNGAPFCAPLGGNCIALEWFSGAGGSMLDTSMPSDALLSDIANGRYGPNAYDYQPNRSGRTNLNSVFRGTAHSWCPQGWYMTALSHSNDRGNTVDPYSGTPSAGYADDEDFRIWCCKLIN